MDHGIPKAAGGSGDPSNGDALCRKCNRSKSDGPRPWQSRLMRGV
ncbi:HNH endonuclease [Micromonospora tulbaghiae]